ncbi:MAG: hypothetical protein JWR50_3403 [Mucilaginibacter sp.]|nr:hypothetical protein [Mucilaginibacter sp.]
MEINLHLILLDPPPAVTFGLQKGSGNTYQTIQTQRSGTEDLHFKFSIEIKGDKQKDALPGFKGPFVQGPRLGNFFYIDIGTYSGESESVWGRRLKVPLTGITWELIDKLAATQGAILQTIVPVKGKDGTPNCATVKPFAGWAVKQPIK